MNVVKNMYPNIVTKRLSFSKEARAMAFLVALFSLIALAAFGLGRFSALTDKEGQAVLYEPTNAEVAMKPAAPVKPVITANTVNGTTTPGSETVQSSGAFVASKNGSKYYGLACAGASRIKAENRVWFKSAQEAEAAGYALAANCTP